MFYVVISQMAKGSFVSLVILEYQPCEINALKHFLVLEPDLLCDWFRKWGGKKGSLFVSQPGTPVHLSLVREAANFKLRYGRKKDCIIDLEQLWKQNPKDVHTLAQLISAYSLVDQDKAKAYPCVHARHAPCQYLCHMCFEYRTPPLPKELMSPLRQTL